MAINPFQLKFLSATLLQMWEKATALTASF